MTGRDLDRLKQLATPAPLADARAKALAAAVEAFERQEQTSADQPAPAPGGRSGGPTRQPLRSWVRSRAVYAAVASLTAIAIAVPLVLRGGGTSQTPQLAQAKPEAPATRSMAAEQRSGPERAADAAPALQERAARPVETVGLAPPAGPTPAPAPGVPAASAPAMAPPAPVAGFAVPSRPEQLAALPAPASRAAKATASAADAGRSRGVAKQAARAAPTVETSAWVRLCEPSPLWRDAKGEPREVCLVLHERIDPDTGLAVVSAAVREISGEPVRHLLVTIGGTIDLGVGIQVRIDGSEPAIKLPASLCRGGCTGEIAANEALLGRLAAGRELVVEALRQTGETLRFRVPLASFRAALAGPPIEARAYRQMQPLMSSEPARMLRSPPRAREEGAAGAITPAGKP
jgi:invasion protein IalB